MMKEDAWKYQMVLRLFWITLAAMLLLSVALDLGYGQVVVITGTESAGGATPTYTASTQSGEFTMTGTTGYAVITPVDSTQTWVYCQIGPATDGVDYAMGDFVAVDWYCNDTSNDSLVFYRGSSSYDPIVRWWLVSDPGITSVVYRGSFTAASEDVTISTVDTSKTWIGLTYSASTGGYDNDQLYAYFSDVTNVKLTRDNTGSTLTYRVWVITYDSCTVQMRYSAAAANSHVWSDLTGLSATKTWAIVTMAVTTSSCYRRGFNAGVVDATTAQVNTFAYSSSQNITAQFITFTDQSTVLADSQIQLTGTELNESATIATHATGRTTIHLPGAYQSYGRSIVDNATGTHAYYWVFAELLSATSYDLTRTLQDATQGVGAKVFINEWNGAE